MIQIIILYALFASTFSLGKVLLSYASPIFLVGIRMSIAGFILLTYQAWQTWRSKKSFKINKKHWRFYIEAILFTCYFPYILRFWGLQHMSPAKASLLYTLGPFISYLLAYWLLKEKVTIKKIVGLLIGFLGLLPVLISPAPNEALMGGFGFFSWAEFYVILSISCLSYGWIALHRLIKNHQYHPTMVNGISMFAGGILALLTSFVVELHEPVSNIPYFLAILAVVIIVSNLLCHNIYGMLLKKYSPTFLSFASFLTPLFAALYDWFFFHRAISWEFFISVGCVFLGLTIFYQDSFSKDSDKHTADNTNVNIEELEC